MLIELNKTISHMITIGMLHKQDVWTGNVSYCLMETCDKEEIARR